MTDVRSGLVRAFEERFGRRPEVWARVPGRINLMGRHVDHQGGDVNMMALDRHLALAVGPAEGRAFRLRSADPVQYPDFDLDPAEARIPAGEAWEKTIERQALAAWREGLPLWTRYLAGSILRLEREVGGALPALDVLVQGNLPPAAGLSSSSALVLGFVLAIEALMGRRPEAETLVRLASESERFLGVRGGASDPAAMLASRPGQIVHLGCLPFVVKGAHPFSPGYRIVLANSHDTAMKGRGARNDYNWRVAVYRIALVLLRWARPEWIPRLQHLRDLHPDGLGVPLPEIYLGIRSLPQRITRGQLAARHPRETEELAPVFTGHEEPPDGYPVRDILLYGMGEMARSMRLGKLLDRGDYAGIGRWMNCSHDGDRVSRASAAGREPWRSPTLTDGELERMARLAERGDPKSDLAQQTGGYTCSTPNVDAMVDLCLGTEGCAGAQILGAGLGGCMMALVQAGGEEEVIRRLRNAYYAPRGLPTDAWCTFPGPGAMVERV